MWTKLYSTGLILKFVSRVFPKVDRELNYWHAYAQAYSGKELSVQALASIENKRFHCQGGSIYSLYNDVEMNGLVRLVTALQTISDYLDNLCDRAGVADEQAFRQLHLAMTAALDPESTTCDYYRFYPFSNDGNYLNSLVSTCRQEVIKLPAYPIVKPYILKLATWYAQLQTYKHLQPSLREQKMTAWTSNHLHHYADITPWEFAAATGSTLGIFMLCAAAARPNLSQQEAEQIFSAYFPWICGLHILLDYFIDRTEDTAGGDLNFTAYYANSAEMLSRLKLFSKQAFIKAESLPHPGFTKTVTYGLLAMYLSDPKALAPQEKPVTRDLLNYAGTYTKFLHILCRLLRKHKII